MKATMHLSEEEIALSAEAMIAKDLTQLDIRIRKHLDQCAQCSSEVMMVAELSAEIPDVSIIPIKTNPIWRYAAMLAASVVLVLLVYNLPGLFNSSPNPSAEMALLASDSSASSIDEHKLEQKSAVDDTTPIQTDDKNNSIRTKSILSNNALAYAPNDALESLVSNNRVAYRSDDAIILLSQVEIQFPEIDSLVWQNPEKILLTIEWYNTQGVLIQSLETNKDGISIPSFKNGLYYWKLMNEDFDLLGVGKVRVRL